MCVCVCVKECKLCCAWLEMLGMGTGGQKENEKMIYTPHPVPQTTQRRSAFWRRTQLRKTPLFQITPNYIFPLKSSTYLKTI